MSQSEKIAKLNDKLRRTLQGGEVVFTSGLSAIAFFNQKDIILQKVAECDYFTEDNDPYGERDFGVIYWLKRKLFWKIDYYDLDMLYHSDNPADPAKTRRVLTVMLAEEY
jgi:hypothetical protein